MSLFLSSDFFFFLRRLRSLTFLQKGIYDLRGNGSQRGIEDWQGRRILTGNYMEKDPTWRGDDHCRREREIRMKGVSEKEKGNDRI